MATPHRVLLIGASGLLGGNAMELLTKEWSIYAVSLQTQLRSLRSSVVCQQIDITTWQSVADIERDLGGFVPTVIIHSAAFTNVDVCEQERERTYALHVRVTEVIAAYAAAHHIHLIFISTDHLFAGDKGGYTEIDEPHALNYYAETKRLAEQCVQTSGAPYTIIRTNFFGYNIQSKGDFAGWILSSLQHRTSLTLFPDIIFSPIYVGTLVEYIRRVVLEPQYGILHIAAHDACSKYDFGMRLAALFSLDSSLIVSQPSHFSVRRPKNMSLNVSKVEKIFGHQMPTVNESLMAYKAAFDAGYPLRIKQWVTP